MKRFCQIILGILSFSSAQEMCFGDSLKIAAKSLPAHFHPVLMRSPDEQYLGELIHGKLIFAGSNWLYQCSICESIPLPAIAKAKADKAKAKTIHLLNWKIRKNMQWANGVPVTGWDVRFSFELSQAARELRGTANHSAIRSVIVNDQDAAEFSIQLDSNISDYLYDLDFPILPAAIEEPIWIGAEKNLDRYLNQSEYTKNPFNKDLYSGCYFPLRKDSTGLDLGIHTNCGSGKPQFDHARIELVTPSIKTSIQSQQFDIFPETIFAQEISEWSSANDKGEIPAFPGYRFDYSNDGRREMLILNLRNPMFADRKIREVLAGAIDARELQKILGWPLNSSSGIFSDESMVGAVAMPPSNSPSPSPALPLTIRSDEQLRAALQALRFKLNSDGIWHRDGQSLSFTLTYLPEPGFRKRIAEYIRDRFKKVGIGLKLQEVSSEEFRKKVFGRSYFPDLTLVSWELKPGVVPFSILHSAAIPGSDNNYRGQNIGGIFSKKMDEALGQWAGEFDQTQHPNIRTKINQLFTSEVYAIALALRPRIVAVSNELEGFVATSHSRPSSLLASGWQPAKKSGPSP